MSDATVYRTTRRTVEIGPPLSDAEFTRCVELAGHFPTQHNVFECATDEQVTALQDYLLSARLPHQIETTRVWAPTRRCKACPNPVAEGQTWCSTRCQNADDPQRQDEE